MATYWIDNVSGSDAWNGTQATPGVAPDGPVASWNTGVGLLTAGDTLNVINTGTPYVQPSGSSPSVTGLAGTDYDSDPGCIIQGTDADGDPSLTELRWQDDNVSHQYLQFAATNSYCWVRGFYANAAANSTTSTAKNFVHRTANTSDHIRISSCHFTQGAATGVVFKGNDAYSTYGGEITNCYIKDPSTAIVCRFSRQGAGEFHHNVVIKTSAASGVAGSIVDVGSADYATTDHRVYNNTVIIALGAPGVAQLLDATERTPVSGVPVKHLHSNVYMSLQVATAISFTRGNSGATSANWAMIIGWNVFINPNGNTYNNFGPYQKPFDPDDSDSPEGTQFWATDVNDTAADADPFQDSSSAWNWEIGGYTIPLAGDYRMAQYRTSARGGGIPGAIQDTVPLDPSPPSPPSDPPIWTGDPGVIGPTKPGKLTASGRFQARKNLGIQIDQNARTDPDTPLVATTIVPASYVIAASGTQAISLGTLSPATNLILSADQDITLTVDSAAFLLKKGGCFLLSVGSITTLSVTNLSSVSSVTVNYFASDG